MRHPYKTEDPKRDPNLENYSFRAQGLGFGVLGFGVGCRVQGVGSGFMVQGLGV